MKIKVNIKFFFHALQLFLIAELSSQTIDPKFTEYLAAERLKLPVEGLLLYDCADVSNYKLVSAIEASLQQFDVKDSLLPFVKAYRVIVNTIGKNPWEPQFMSPRNTSEIHRGDMLFWIFYARTVEAHIETGQAKGYFYAQLARDPWTGIASWMVSPGTDWTRYYIYGEAKEDFPPGTMEVTIHLGYYAQSVEFGGFIGLNLGQHVDSKDIPKMEITYNGRDPTALWRNAALQRIETFRKGDLKIHVLDGNGKGSENAVVNVRMTSHAFQFGSFVNQIVLQKSWDAKIYRESFLELFNVATSPFYMGDGTTWGWYSSDRVKQEYYDIAAWLQNAGIPTKGHVLIWPGWQWMTPAVKDLEKNPEGLHQALIDHLDEVVPVGRNLGVVQWDVMNEPYTNHDIMDILGDHEISNWYKRVHEIHPDAQLIINETGVITGGGNRMVQDNLARIISLLQADNAPIHGIGFQGHFGSYLTDLEEVYAILERFSEFGLPIQITEFDIDIDDEAAQADYTRDFLTMIFSHPSVNKFVMWGFWEPNHWIPRGAMIREDWTVKPNGYAYEDLVFNQWWTRETGRTDVNGDYDVRGFLGTYSIEISKDGMQVEGNVDLIKEGVTVQVRFPDEMTFLDQEQNQWHDFGLILNFPNPFNDQTVIHYQLSANDLVNIRIFNIRGTQVAQLLRKWQIAGMHCINFNAQNLPSGIYITELKAGDRVSRQKMILVR